MTAAEQGRAILLLKRWRDACREGTHEELEDQLSALTVLFLETDAFLNFEAPPISKEVAS